MMLIGVFFVWEIAIVCAGFLGMVALISQIQRRARKLAIGALVISFTPLVVALLSLGALSKYGRSDDKSSVLFGLSMLPPLLSLIAVYVSKKPLANHDGD
jgi:hypothetical protein